MRFECGAPGTPSLGLAAAALRGLPDSGGRYLPSGEADLRPALYAPASSFPDFAAAAALALFPDELDPLTAERLAASAFASAPPSFAYGDDILVLDLAAGASGSSEDYGARFLAGILADARARSGNPRLVLADGSLPDAAALVEAFAREKERDGLEGEPLVLLMPRGSSLRGVKPLRLARNGGRTFVLDVRCGPGELEPLLAKAACSALAGRAATVAGPHNPARFAARIILHAAAFSLASRGSSGDVIGALAHGDGLALAAALWGWRLGLPQSALLLSRCEGAADDFTTCHDLVEHFEGENPGAFRSLVRRVVPSPAQADEARAALAFAGGPELDQSSACSLAAAELALTSGLRGHARIVVYRESLPISNVASVSAGASTGSPSDEPLSGLPADVSIEPSLEALEAALARLI